MEKLKVGDIAKTLGIDPQTVREWSAQFSDFLSEDANPPRGATRYYNEDDLNALTFVYKLRRNDATFQEISEALTLEQHRFTMPNLIVRGDSPLSGLGSGTGIIKTSDIEHYIKLEGQLEEVRGERDYLRVALREEREAHSATMTRAARAEDRVRGVGHRHVARPCGDRVGAFGADHLMAALRRAVARALRHHADEAGRRGVVRAPAAALGPPPRLRAPGNRVAGALADVAGLGGAVGEVVVDVAGPRLVAEAALAARPGVGQAATVALVGDAGVVVVAVDVDAAKAEAVVAVDAAGRRSVALLGGLDQVRGAVAGDQVVAGVHCRRRVEGDGDGGVIEADERAAAAAAHEGLERGTQDR